MVSFRRVSQALVAACLISIPATQAQDPVPAPVTPTIWSFLGIPQGVKKVQGALVNTKGKRPKLEPKPALKALNDPANLKSPDAAIKKAAEVKQAEDLKPQKIKAIKYLTSMGCGCYDKNGEITKAMIASAEDCTEDVRLVTMQELLKAACGKCCSECGKTCCCSDDLLKKLAEIAYKKKSDGCYVEPSLRVRQAAVKVLEVCCTSQLPPIIEAEKIQTNGNGGSSGGEPKKDDESSSKGEGKSTSSNQFSDDEIAYRDYDSSIKHEIDPSLPLPIYNPNVYETSTPNPNGGVVIGYAPDQALAYVHFENQKLIAPLDSVVYICKDPAYGSSIRGMWRVVSTASGRANLAPVDRNQVIDIKPGDHVKFGEPTTKMTQANYRR